VLNFGRSEEKAKPPALGIGLLSLSNKPGQ